MPTLTVRVAAEIEGLRKGLQDASKTVEQHAQAWQSAGLKLAAAGGAITAAVGATAMAAVKFGTQMHIMTQRTGISATALAKLKFAAEQSGASFESLSSGLRFLSRNMADAAGGTGEAAQAFKALGISVKDAEGNLRPATDVLLEAADKLRAMENDTQRTAFALDIFGRSAMDLIPMLREGSAGIEELGKWAESLGLVMDDKAAAAARRLGDQIDALKGSAMGVAMSIGTTLLPVVERLVRAALVVTTRIVAWVRENEGLVRIIGTAALVIGGLITTVGSLALGVSLAMKAFALLTGAVVLLTAKITLIIAGIVALGIAVAAAIRQFDDFSRAAKGLGQIIAGLLLLLSPAGIFMWRTALDLMRTGWDNLKTGVSGAVSGIVSDVRRAFDSVKSVFADASTDTAVLATQFEGAGVKIGGALGKTKTAAQSAGVAWQELASYTRQALGPLDDFAIRAKAAEAAMWRFRAEAQQTTVAVSVFSQALRDTRGPFEDVAGSFDQTIAKAVQLADELGLTIPQALQRIKDMEGSIDWIRLELTGVDPVLRQVSETLMRFKEPWQEGIIKPAQQATVSIKDFVDQSQAKAGSFAEGWRTAMERAKAATVDWATTLTTIMSGVTSALTAFFTTVFRVIFTSAAAVNTEATQKFLLDWQTALSGAGLLTQQWSTFFATILEQIKAGNFAAAQKTLEDWRASLAATGALTPELAAKFNEMALKIKTDMANAANESKSVWERTKDALGALWDALKGVVIKAIAEMLAKWVAAHVAMRAEALATAIAAIWASVAKLLVFSKPLAIALALAAIAFITGMIKLAKGGIAVEPTVAMIGEAGPEAVIPLDRLGEFVNGDNRQTIKRLDRVIELLEAGQRRKPAQGVAFSDLWLDRETALQMGLAFSAAGVR